MSLYRIAVLLCVLLSATTAVATPFNIERDLWSEVLINDGDSGLTPVSKEQALSSSVIYFEFDNDGKRLQLGVKLSHPSYLFRNGKLVSELAEQTWFIEDTAQLIREGRKLYAIYTRDGTFNLRDSVVLFNNQAAQVIGSSPQKVTSAPISRSDSSDKSHIIILGLLVFAFQVLIRTVAPGYFSKLLDLRKAIISVEFEEESGHPLLSREHLLLLFASAFNIALLYVLIGHSRLMLVISQRVGNSFEVFGQPVFLEFTLAALTVVALIVLKYIVSAALSSVIGAVKLADIHRSQFIKIVYVLSSVVADLVFILLLSEINHSPTVLGLLPALLMFTMLLVMVNVVIYIYKWTSVHNNLLFSYLCATEILPILLIFIYF